MVRGRHPNRRGAVAVEAAIVYPVLFLLIFGIIVGGMGGFRYQVVAGMAREGGRYAAVRGSGWKRDSNQPAPTAAQIARDAVLPLAVSMDPAQVVVRVQLIDGVSGAATDWDASNKATASLNAAG